MGVVRLVMVGMVAMVGMVGAEVQGSQDPPYLGSYQVEDSCQFQLCGVEYSGEFTGPQARPKVGSCSGDCHLLATNMNTNKFHREFLWSQCARMCNQKFPPSHYRQYKPRFECMEQCYTSYRALSPHHSLARYCIQASCPHQSAGQMHQVDCFSSCSSHVSSSVAKTDWQAWASALAGPCQQEGRQGEVPTQTHRLECADSVVWSSTSSPLAPHCLQHLCHGDIRCGRTCLDHVAAVEEGHRSIWRGCSLSATCLALTPGERLGCADTCLADHRKKEKEREERERRRKQEQRKQQALLAVRSGAPLLTSSLLLPSLLLLLLPILHP